MTCRWLWHCIWPVIFCSFYLQTLFWLFYLNCKKVIVEPERQQDAVSGPRGFGLRSLNLQRKWAPAVEGFYFIFFTCICLSNLESPVLPKSPSATQAFQNCGAEVAFSQIRFILQWWQWIKPSPSHPADAKGKLDSWQGTAQSQHKTIMHMQTHTYAFRGKESFNVGVYYFCAQSVLFSPHFCCETMMLLFLEREKWDEKWMHILFLASGRPFHSFST